MIVDRSLRFVDANSAYLRVTDSRFEDIRGRRLFDAFPGGNLDREPDNVRQVRTSLERVIETGRTDVIALVHYPMARETINGIVYEDRFWSATHTPLFDEAGRVAHVLQHTVDVTEHYMLKRALQRAEAEIAGSSNHAQTEEGVFRRAQQVQEAHASLYEEHRRLTNLIDEAPSFTAFVQGERHVFEFANRAYLRLIGDREIVGLPVEEALPEVAGQGFFDLLDEVRSTGKPFVGRGMRVMLQRGDSTDLEEAVVDFIYQPIHREDGTVYGILVQGHDVSEQYRVQRELEILNETLERRVAERTIEIEKRNRELQEFAYVASHDLQEPLRKVHSFADILLEEYGDVVDDTGRWYFDRMQGAVRRMSALIKDILVYSRISTGQRVYDRVDFNVVLNEVCADLQLQIDDCGGCVDVGRLPVVHGDPVQFRQLLQNLISNALKFHAEDSVPYVEVRGSVDTEEGTASIAVSDNGIGVSPDFAEQIFQPFRRLHGQSVYDGTGIGLAVCRRIVERHGGSIRVDDNPDGGARFVVELPIDGPRDEPGLTADHASVR
jgi:signal transduction histidine kinase